MSKTTHQYTHHFRWDSSVPDSVSIKGSFDGWQSSLHLKKHPSGKFSAPIDLVFGSKVTYKYVVDGTWRHNPKEPTETDSNGNINNVFQVPQAPSITEDPVTNSAQSAPNPVTTMSSDALVEESLGNSPVQGISTDSKPLIDDMTLSNCTEPNTLPPMSVVFPTTSSEQVPKKPSATKRTTSLLTSATRFARPSYRAASLAPSAPGTPTEKASPAGASVTNVVSALAGVAATAIPAAILAVTGKDIIQASSKNAPDPSTVDETGETSPTLHQHTPSTNDVATEEATQSTDPVEGCSQTLSKDQPMAPLVVNNAAENSEPKDNALVDVSATHQALPESSIPAQAQPTPTPAKQYFDQVTTPTPHQPLSLAPTAQIVLTPLATHPEPPAVPTGSTTPVQTNKQQEPSSESAAQSSLTLQSSTEQSVQSPAPPEPSTKTPIGTPSRKVQVDTGCPALDDNRNSPMSARVSFSEEKSSSTRKPSGSPKRASILISSTSASSPHANSVPPGPKSPAPLNERASLGTPSKNGEFKRKTSGWRHSVGSIRSRKTSGETERPSPDNSNSPDPAVHENNDSSSHSGKKSGIFQKIKSAFSPRQNQKNTSTRASSNSYSNRKKRNSFGRTTSIAQV